MTLAVPAALALLVGRVVVAPESQSFPKPRPVGFTCSCTTLREASTEVLAGQRRAHAFFATPRLVRFPHVARPGAFDSAEHAPLQNEPRRAVHLVPVAGARPLD